MDSELPIGIKEIKRVITLNSLINEYSYPWNCCHSLHVRYCLVRLYGYKQTKNASDYLLGGRKVNPIIMALSYGATFISASAIVGFGGVAATFGMGIQWLCLLNMFMGVVVAFIFFGRRTRKLGEEHNARTFPQLLGLHYNSRSIQIFIATIIFIGCLYMQPLR